MQRGNDGSTPAHQPGSGPSQQQLHSPPIPQQSVAYQQGQLQQFIMAGQVQNIRPNVPGNVQGVRASPASSPVFPAVSATGVVMQGQMARMYTPTSPVGLVQQPVLSPTQSGVQRQFSNPGVQARQSSLSGSGSGPGLFQELQQSPPAYPTTSVSPSGGTIHHHGQSPSRGGVPPLANPQQNILTMNPQPRRSSVSGSTSPGVTPAGNPTHGQTVTSPVPRKKIKTEEKPPASQEVANLRKMIRESRIKDMTEIKENYNEHLTELFFLQNGGNYMDYHLWLKRPTPQLVQFLKSGNLDSDEEDDKKISEDVKVQSVPGSTTPLLTPVATSTTLPPEVSAISQQSGESRKQGGRHGMVFGHIQPPVSQSGTPTQAQPPPYGSQITSTTTATPVRSSIAQQSPALTKAVTENKTPSTLPPYAKVKSPVTPLSRLQTRQHSISAVYDNAIGSQEAIVERAKQEAQVMQRIAELRKEGLWSARRLPKVQEPPRQKAHWDYLLEEMQWLAADFAQERKWKKAACRKIANMVSRYHKEQELKAQRAEKEEGLKLKRIASSMAKMVKEFWTSIEKVVQFKQQTRLEEKRKKALDLHLNFIVDQTEKYSSWLSQGLTSSRAPSVGSGSVMSSPSHIGQDDYDFEPRHDESDDEETIEKEEAHGIDEVSTQKEIEELQKESEMPIEDLLKSLPPEVLEKPAELDVAESDGEEEDGEDFEDEELEDDEETLDEQETHEQSKDHKEELDDLAKEGEMSIEEIMKKYGGAYDSDFEMPESSEGDTDDDEEEEEEEEEETEEDEEEGTDEEKEELEDIGMEYLIHPEKEEPKEKGSGDVSKSPGKEITDIAAAAQSLQPTGYTLETTQVKVPVPFLLKHTLREYQHVGLDWLATMYEKRLNGILADEMGLGKTIQTIALLAHLACEKEIWGPHLIVVPTSVMLNWEMEFKKWCPAFKILTYYGNQKERKQKRQGWTKTNAFHVCITSYKLVIQDHQSFRRKKWKYLVLDEAQNIKNFKSQRWQTLLNFASQRRLLLTGTPLQNNLMELWSLMHFLMPHVFQSHKEFKEWFANPLSGMIEGSQEYNESLIRRLHKVLRPFLLRRLKADVEKQMPKKYEHVVMCRLSKRQRFLYDDFMSQAKTKETLASGHFMSVINILMQLRKVCNHPNLFDPRPILSPFHTEAISFHTASLVLRALEYNPFKHIDLHSFHPGLADLELCLPAYAGHRIKKLQTSKPLIVEIDKRPDPPPRLKPIKLRNFVYRSTSPSVQSGRLSPFAPIQRSASPLPAKSPLARSATSTPTHLQAVKIRTTPTPPLVVPTSINTTQPEQLPGYIPARPGTPGTASGVLLGSSAGVTTSSSQPITVQIHHTQQAGFLQIVQTSTGQHILATPSSAAPVQAVTPIQSGLATTTTVTTSAGTAVTMVNGLSPTSSLVTTASQITTPITKSSPVQLPTVSKSSPIPVQLPTSVTKSSPTPVQLPTTGSSITSGTKPVVRVSPMSTEAGTLTTTVTPATTPGTPSSKPGDLATIPKPTTIVPEKTVIATRSQTKAHEKEVQPKEKSPFYMKSLAEKRAQHRQEKLERIARINSRHCEWKPVYGQDLCAAVNVLNDLRCTKPIDNVWNGLGLVQCHNTHNIKKANHPDYYWRQTDSLKSVIRTPEMLEQELRDILRRFVCFIPAVKSTGITLHTSHPPPDFLIREQTRVQLIKEEVSPKAMCLHRIATNMTMWFPEPRLIQYDCGKLQTLDILLRQLKVGGHRVLIFTQMTKMLDVLEAFLNYHGHIYLRLDGTTRVEMRQALMERFNMDKRIFVFILSTRSGGLGMNLTGADSVIFYDSDWNPTMDAQAQDRCHRIGQTRDVHIYRLISEKTVEENILKKANQKRLMSDVAIEGGNFTTAFFKQNTISELFEEPSGLEQLAKEKAEKEAQKLQERPATPKVKTPGRLSPIEEITESQFEQALCNAEDDTDVQAAKVAKAEQSAELAEFDENIPWDESEALKRKQEEEESKVEQEIAMLEKELMPVERYAVYFMETQIAPFSTEELEQAEEEIQNAKKDWELNRLKALKEEEERRADIEEDEMLFTYSREDATNQVYICDFTGEHMPMWCPPSPPQDENDVYIDNTLCFLYEPSVMAEMQLPPVYVKREHRRSRHDSTVIRKHKIRKDDQPRVPRSLFDRPQAALLKMRREAKLQKFKQGMIGSRQGYPLMSKPMLDPGHDHPEWLIHEDWALLQAVQGLLDLPLNLMVLSPAHTPNWDLVSDVVNASSRVYRSAKQCKNRYENVIIPREEGKILYDINPRKQKKNKGVYKHYAFQTKNNRPMRTSQLFLTDNNNSSSTLYTFRFDCVKSLASKRSPALRPMLQNTQLKNPKHAAVLQENGINYEQPLSPVQVAAIRAERIAREKKQSQQAQQAAAEQLAQQRAQQQQATATVTGTTATVQATTVQGQLQPVATAASATVLQTGTLQKSASGTGVTAVSIARGANSIVVNTAGGVASNSFANINKRMNQTAAAIQPTNVVRAVTGGLTPAIRTQRTTTTPMTVQEISAVVSGQGQARIATTLAGTTQAVSMTAAQFAAQRMTTTIARGTVQQQLAARGLTPEQIQALRKQALFQKQQQQLLQQQKLQQQGVQTKTTKPLTQAEQLKQQQLRRLQAQAAAQAQVQAAAGQKTVAVSAPLVTSLTQAQVTQAAAAQRLQAVKQGQVKQPVSRQMSEQELNALIRRQQLLQQQKQAAAGGTTLSQVPASTQAAATQVSQQQPQRYMLSQAQIISHAQLQQAVASGPVPTTQVATLVKTVSAPATVPSVTIPVTAVSVQGVNINVNVPQKVGTSKVGVSAQQQQQLRIQQIQRQRQLQQQQQKVATLTAAQLQQLGKTGQLQPSSLGTVQLIPTPTQQKLQTVQQIQQIIKQQQAAQGGQIHPQIITSVSPAQTSTPAIITTQLVTQAQTVSHVVTKVSQASASPLRTGTAVTIAMPVTISTPSQQSTAQTTVTVVGTTVATTTTPTVTVTHSLPPHTQPPPPNVTITTPATIPSSTATVSQLTRPQQAHVVVADQSTLSPIKQVQVAVTPTQAQSSSSEQLQGIQIQTVQTAGSTEQAQAKTTPYAMRLRNPPKHN